MKRAALVLLVSCHASSSAEPSARIELPAGALHVAVPVRASGILRVERSPDAFVEVEAIGAGEVVGRREGDRVVYEDAFPGTRLVHLATAGRTEELRHVEREDAPTSLKYRVKLGPGLARLRVVEDYVEALDARGVALLRTEPAFLVDARGTRRDLLPRLSQSGATWSLDYDVDTRGLVYPLDIDPAWTTTTSLAKARRDDTLHALPSGKVIALGGLNVTGVGLSSVEQWDEATGSWTSAGFLAKPRAYHAACTLPSGKVFVAGGPTTGAMPDVDSSAELFDPATSTGKLLSGTSPEAIGDFARALPVSATQVMVAHDGSSLLVDVTAGTFTAVPYVEARNAPTIALFGTGKALVVGGYLSSPTAPLSSAEIFDLATKKWTKTSSMVVARNRGEAVTLLSGKVLVAGGVGLSSAEIFDPSTSTWKLTGAMTTIHSFNGMALLPSGKVVSAGGDLPSGLTDRTDLYDPVSGTWAFAGKLHAPLDEFGFAVLPSGKLMIAGGSNGSPVPTAQIFDPLPNGKACIGAGECTSGFCVDGACCGESACAAGKTCGGSGAPGSCLALDGSTCANDAECGSAHCVDDVCCATACAETCAACNLAGSEGKCVAVPAGDAPHGTRAACPGEGACQARCGGVDATKCSQFPGTPVSCAPATCSAGTETRPRGCDGAGSCAPGVTHDCAPYVCGASACKTQCDVDADCASGNTCDLVSRRCVIAATCDGDRVKSPEGALKDCAPYHCANGRCGDSCTDSTACADGYLCDTASSKCVRGDTGGDASSGGCAFGRASPSSSLLVLLVLGLLGSQARLRRRDAA
jgi:hypothetical protein